MSNKYFSQISFVLCISFLIYGIWIGFSIQKKTRLLDPIEKQEQKKYPIILIFSLITSLVFCITGFLYEKSWEFIPIHIDKQAQKQDRLEIMRPSFITFSHRGNAFFNKEKTN
ncbi:membrane magnesium transporter 1 [Anaeramoeba ignava]|uniref:Membrane magnesium transporter 1 n=1 Tax=Anaeramoeba ignava TaxID=1746090 RepID=A0A9Q0LX73_ANAIG|nr:membrane magnesium transporter 1 [Anaeramoeba ignava]